MNKDTSKIKRNSAKRKKKLKWINILFMLMYF